MLVLSCVLGATAARAEDHAATAAEKPESGETGDSSGFGLPKARGLEFQFHLDASWGSFGFLHSFYANPKPDEPSGNLSDNWFEGAVKPGLSVTYTTPSLGQLYGKISAAGERSYGTPPSPVGEDASSFQLDDLHLGWRSGKLLPGLGENALDFTVGRAPYQLGHGFLVWDGGVEGGSRGGYWSNIRRAFSFASIGRFKTGPHTVEAFYLVRDELPEAATGSKVLGFNYELALGEATTLGATYLRGFAHKDQRPTRDGLNVYNLRAFTAPFSKLRGLSFEAEYAREQNGDLLASTAWTVQAAYELDMRWKPRLSYRFAYFQGDDPGTSRSEAFDPLFLGFYDWGTWWQGEIAGEYFVSNSNLLSHQVRLHTSPLESLSTGLIFYKFLLDQAGALGAATGTTVTSTDVATELDWYTDWKVNPHFTLSLIAAWASPGDAAAQAFGRTQDFWYSMLFAAYSY
ncbi:MAG TPA: alginate export family protein [Myxococcales bacterium]|nr:alginate export family protein [Myxococcales bacterium]